MPAAPDRQADHSAEQTSPPFKQVAILGTGLIGGSFGLALRQRWPRIKIAGWDRPQVLQCALELGAITHAAENLEAALRDADLIYIALPVHVAMEILPTVSRHARPEALVTDACGTKVAICNLAAKLFPVARSGSTAALFLGGHPVAGKELSGIEHASKNLFERSRYALVPPERAEPSHPAPADNPRIEAFLQIVLAIGAKAAFCDPETHDWATAIVSHLPQLLSIALAGVVLDESDDTDPSGLPASLAGNGLRDMTRLAGSPYSVWRDICLTNSTNISRALDRLAQRIDYLRTHLASKELESEFRSANHLYKTLREMQ